MRQYQEYTIFSGKGTTGIGINILAEDFKHAIFSIASDGGGDAAATVKIVGSVSEDAPNFAAAQSVSNMYDFIQLVDYEDGSAKNGDEGIVFSSADDYRLAEANVNGLRYLNARITAITAGELTVKVKLYNNQ